MWRHGMACHWLKERMNKGNGMNKFMGVVGVGVMGALFGACAMGLFVVWANEVNVGLQLKSLNCFESSSTGVDSYVCYVEA